MRTAVPGRVGRGRKYFPFPSEEANTDEGRPSAAYLLILAAIGAALIIPITTGAGGNTATVRYTISDAGYSRSFPVSSFVTRTAWGTQRRRSYVNKADQLPF